MKKIKFTCSEIPDPEAWEKGIYGDKKQENVITLMVDNKEKTSIPIFRVLGIKKLPTKKDVKYWYYGLIKNFTGTYYFEIVINHSRKTCKIKSKEDICLDI